MVSEKMTFNDPAFIDILQGASRCKRLSSVDYNICMLIPENVAGSISAMGESGVLSIASKLCCNSMVNRSFKILK